MSRSYKKHPIIKYAPQSGKYGKREANQKVRRDSKNNPEEAPLKGKSYKKQYSTWEIHDVVTRWTLREAIDAWYEEEAPHYRGTGWRHDRYKTLKNWIKYWKTTMQRK